MHKVQEIANFFLAKGREDEIAICPMKLLKLVYLAYGWYQVAFEERLFNDSMEVWPNGPVVPALYFEFKEFGKNAIDRYAYLRNLQTGEVNIPRIPVNQIQVLQILELVWNAYKYYPAWKLSDESHEEGSPWKKARSRGDNYLQEDDIASYFKAKLKQYADEAAAKSQLEKDDASVSTPQTYAFG